jgi:polysaccharide biosynthesis protein PelF
MIAETSKAMPRQPRRVLFVFAWIVVGGEETEVRLLARYLDPRRYTLSVVGCFRKPGMPEQTHTQLEALGVEVDKTPYILSFEDTVAYLAKKIPAYNLIVACQAVPDVVPALDRIAAQGFQPPPLIEHGGLVQETTAGPKHRTARYVGVCQSIRDAAASMMPDRPQHALEIPSMVDLSEFDPNQRAAVRMALGVADGELIVGWVGRLDRKKRVEDFIHAAALVHARRPEAHFVVVGGPDAFMPEYADELRALAEELGIANRIVWTGDRPDVPRLLAGFDVFVWLSRGEGMPHVIAEAGAAALPVVATCDNGTAQQMTHGETGLFVPHEDPLAVARAVETLLADPALCRTLGQNLRRKVEREYSAAVVTRRWEALFDEVIAETQ